jgi:purine-cytosine permease-like protein
MAKYIVHKRINSIIFTDVTIFAAGLSIYGITNFKYHWSYGIVTFLALFFGALYLFFINKIFRYIFSILFSLIYGLLFAFLGSYTDKQNPTTPAAIFGILAFVISLFFHKDHFNFIKDAKSIEYDNY